MPGPDVTPPASDFTCACETLVRAACEDLPFYKKHDGDRYCILHYPGEEKAEEFLEVVERKLEAKDFNFSGVWFPPLADFTGREFTGDASFNSAIFSGDAYFNEAIFYGAADFTRATFRATASFTSVTFDAAYFIETSFGAAADFIKATFYAVAYFISSTFEGNADFTSATFKATASFFDSTFKRMVLFVATTYEKECTASFNMTRFDEGVRFQSCEFAGQLPFNLDGSIIEKAERVVFHTVALSPRWFVNVDPRKFNFINVSWGELGGRAIAAELKSLQRQKKFSNPYNLLMIAYRQLATNAEDNNRYGEAADFRHAAMLTRSLEIRRQFRRHLLPSDSPKRFKVLKFWFGFMTSLSRRGTKLRRKRLRRLSWGGLRESWRSVDPLHSLYGFASGYGENVGRAALVLIGIWLLFAFGYWQGDPSWWKTKTEQKPATQTTSGQVQAPPFPLTLSFVARTQGGETAPTPAPPTLSFRDAVIYSGGVLTLQKPEPLPASQCAKALVLFEVILGPLQAALLALAIRRKFMR